MRLHLSTSRGPARSLHKTGVREEGGAELVEAALVISFLVMLLLGVIVMARAYNVAETINRAADRNHHPTFNHQDRITAA